MMPFQGSSKQLIQPQMDENEKPISPTLKRSYDELGNVTALIDAKKASTLAQYNIRGKPCKIQYPDGSEEHFEYGIRGLLKKSKSRHGSRTRYQYDYLARPVLEETYSADGHLLKCITRKYTRISSSRRNRCQRLYYVLHI